MLDLAVTCNGKSVVTANGDRTASVFQVGGKTSHYKTNKCPKLGPATTASTQLAHTAPVMAMSAHPTSPHHVASGCMDGTVRIWDLRNTQGAVENFLATGDQPTTSSDGKSPMRSKVLALDWCRGSILGCAGEKGIDVWTVNVGN